MTPENERKAAYLGQYRKSRKLEKQCREELAQLYVDICVPSIKQSDGMPHGSGNNMDLSDGMVSIERYEANLKEQIAQSERLRADIADAISALEDREEQTVLRSLYLDKRKPTWDELGKAVNASARTAQRIYGRALHNFRIPAQYTATDKKFLGIP